MLHRLVCAGAIVLSLSACRTTDEDTASDAKAMPPGAQGLPVPQNSNLKLLVSLEDEAAQGMYDVLNAEEQSDQIGGRKSFEGAASIFCERTNGGGNLPPGAQGIVAPQSYNCSMLQRGGGASFPPGVQGMPMAPLMVLEGRSAGTFYNGFNVPESSNRKQFQGNVVLGCQYTETNGVRSAYSCQVRGEATTDDNGGETPAELLALDGADAKSFYDKLKIQAANKTKARTGDTVIHCEKHGFGGAIPPGAQGIVAAATYSCQFVAPANIPDGAQGFPGPSKVLAKFDGSLASVVFNKLAMQTADIEGGQLKEFDGVATILCSYKKVSGKNVYTCSVKQASDDQGGMPPGAQGLPMPTGN